MAVHISPAKRNYVYRITDLYTATICITMINVQMCKIDTWYTEEFSYVGATMVAAIDMGPCLMRAFSVPQTHQISLKSPTILLFVQQFV